MKERAKTMAAPILSTANKQLRKEMQDKHIALWKVADKIGVAESTLCRRMRYELEESDKAEIKKAIEELTMAAG